MLQADISLLYKRHAPMVFRRAKQLLGSDAEAHEAMQDVFVALFERPEQFRKESRASTFLYSVTTNRCLSHLRNERNRGRLRGEHAAELTQAEASPELSPEQRMLLRNALQALPEELAQVAVYRYLDGLSQDEVALVMKCSRRHVNNLLSRLRDWGQSEKAL